MLCIYVTNYDVIREISCVKKSPIGEFEKNRYKWYSRHFGLQIEDIFTHRLFLSSDISPLLCKKSFRIMPVNDMDAKALLLTDSRRNALEAQNRAF